MTLIMWGMNYLTADLDLREKISWSESEIRELLIFLKSEPGIDEALLLTTCNRTEVYINSSQPEFAEISVNHLMQRYLEKGLHHEKKSRLS